MCEMLGYYELLDKADDCVDPIEQLIYVTAFMVARFSHTTRTTKPFNPLLGETFEYVNRDKFRFIAEQVETHPPTSVCYADNPHWSFHEDMTLKTKFTGNTLECYPSGHHHLKLKKSGDYYTWNYITTIVHSIFIDSMEIVFPIQYSLTVT
jgi:hypothetical protein